MLPPEAVQDLPASITGTELAKEYAAKAVETGGNVVPVATADDINCHKHQQTPAHRSTALLYVTAPTTRNRVGGGQLWSSPFFLQGRPAESRY